MDEPLPSKEIDREPLIEMLDTDEIIQDAKNNINIDITTTITLYNFEIKHILIIPSTSATITITIHTSHLPVDRIVFLQGESYFAWSTCDDYLYDYIRENIKSIY